MLEPVSDASLTLVATLFAFAILFQRHEAATLVQGPA